MSTLPLATGSAGTHEATTYRWYACEVVSGNVLDELPIQATSPLPRTIGRHDTADVALPIPAVPAAVNWEVATLPGRTLLVCERVHDQRIVWGGIVVRRNRVEKDTAPECTLSLATCESYLDRRLNIAPGGLRIDQCSLGASLVEAIVADDIGFDYDIGASSILRDRTYVETDRHTVYYELQLLSGVINGPEWTVDLAWATDTDTRYVRKTFRIRDRLGIIAEVPEAVFDLPGCITDITLDEDYSTGKGATWVVAISDGEGDNQPTSTAAVAVDMLAAGWPLYQHVSSYSGITNLQTLREHARQDLTVLMTGARVLTLTADTTAAPELLTAWDLGHSIAVQIRPGTSPAFPHGLDAVARAIGWELDIAANRVSPRLWQGSQGGTIEDEAVGER